MKQIKGVALTERGIVKTAVRNTIKAKDVSEVDALISDYGFEYCAEKSAFVLPRQDEDGNEVYTVLTLTVTNKHPLDQAERKEHKASPQEVIEIE